MFGEKADRRVAKWLLTWHGILPMRAVDTRTSSAQLDPAARASGSHSRKRSLRECVRRCASSVCVHTSMGKMPMLRGRCACDAEIRRGRTFTICRARRSAGSAGPGTCRSAFRDRCRGASAPSPESWTVDGVVTTLWPNLSSPVLMPRLMPPRSADGEGVGGVSRPHWAVP